MGYFSGLLYLKLKDDGSMLSVADNEFLTFLAKYFTIPVTTILQKSLDQHIISATDSDKVIIDTLQELLGYQRRLLEPLSVALTKTSAFDTICSLQSLQVFDKHCSLLIADRDNFFRLIYFKKKPTEIIPFTTGDILKIDGCYFKEGKLFTNQLPKKIWFYDLPALFTIRDYFLDNLPECIYDEDYTKKTALVNIIGYLYSFTRNDKLFLFVHSKQLQIRLIPYKTEDLDLSLQGKLVRITYCELDYGPDAFQVKMSEHSVLTVKSTITSTLPPEAITKLMRFEYPSYRMALTELTDKAVAQTKVTLMQVDHTDQAWQFYGYDASQAVCLTVFDELFGELLATYITDPAVFLIDGVYKRGKKYYVRERLENFQLIKSDEEEEEEEDMTVPVINPVDIMAEELVILDVYIVEVTDKVFLNKDNKQEKYEKIKGISYNTDVSVHNYNKHYYQKLLVGKTYRLFFCKSKFFAGRLYFIMNSTTVLQVLTL